MFTLHVKFISRYTVTQDSIATPHFNTVKFLALSEWLDYQNATSRQYFYIKSILTTIYRLFNYKNLYFWAECKLKKDIKQQ